MFGWFKKEVVFVPLFDNDIRTRKQKWEDVSYLETIIGFSNNNIWRGELLEMLKASRERESKAKDQNEWNACHKATNAIMGILYLPEVAKRQKEKISQEIKARKEGLI